MKNFTIFLLILLAIVATYILALRDTSRTATVEGIFSDQLRVIGHPRAYLRNAADDSILDSCVISDNRFQLACDIARKELCCRITITGCDSASEIVLHPQQHVQLHIGPDPLDEQWRQAVEEAIARLDSAGLTPPDSLAAINSQNDTGRHPFEQRPASVSAHN